MMPLRLHGYPVSNFFNIARSALIEKELPHEIVVVRASQDDEFLSRSPMGKIPVLEVDGSWIGETVAILEFLEDAFEEAPALRPTDLLDRARARQIINVVQMYVEAPARSLFPGVFVAGTVTDAARSQARTTLDRATGALRRMIEPAPFLFGGRPGCADLFAFYNLDVADRVTRFLFGRSIIEEIGIASWAEAMRERPSTRTVLEDFEPLFLKYLEDHDGPYRRPAQQPKQPTHA